MANEIDIRVTTSELTDLQLFTYRFKQYHDVLQKQMDMQMEQQ
jgi:hypothetical protein